MCGENCEFVCSSYLSCKQNYTLTFLEFLIWREREREGVVERERNMQRECFNLTFEQQLIDKKKSIKSVVLVGSTVATVLHVYN